MKLAISTDGNNVSAHFGRCPSFTIIEVEDRKLINREVLTNPGHHPGFIPKFLNEKGVTCIVAGGMGTRAKMLFDEMRIETIVGVSGKIEETIKQILEGTLKGGESLCNPGAGKGYGLDKTECDHGEHDH